MIMAAGTARAGATARILFTNNSNGKLVFCNCPNDPYGGLAERVPLVREYRQTYGDFLLLSSGGYMGLTGVEERGKLVFELMDIMRYDMYGIGDQELFYGLAKFRERFPEQQKNIVSASLRDNDGKPAFDPYRIVETDSVRIGIIGLTSIEAFKFFPKSRMDFTIEDPDVTLGRILPELKEKCDVVVVLSQMGRDKDVEIAGKWDGIDVIIGGHSQTLLEKAIEVSGTKVVQAGKGGGHVGELVIHCDDQRNVKNIQYKLFEVNDRYEVLPEIGKLLKDAVAGTK